MIAADFRMGRVYEFSIYLLSIVFTYIYKVSIEKFNIIKKENYSFSDMLKKCYKSKPWHENADILYVNEKNNSALNIEHAFYDMNEGEENELLNILKQSLKKKSLII